jgi:hypothetical protein
MKNTFATLLLTSLVGFTSCQKRFASFQKSPVSSYVQNEKKQAIEHQVLVEVETKITDPALEQTLYASITNTPVLNEKQPEQLAFDKKQIDAAFEELDKLEKYVNANPNVTADEIMKTNLVEDINLDTNIFSSKTLKSDLPMNIPPFVWGCCLSIAGVAIVYFKSDEDKELTKKALIGCAVGGVGCIGIWLLYSLLGGGYYY